MDVKSISIVKAEPSGHIMVPRLHCESQLSKFRKSTMYKIHIRHIFQVFIPIQAPKDELTISQQLLQEGDQFGFGLLNKPTNQVFEYHLQLVDADEEGADRPNSFVWPKRTPIIIKNEENSDSVSGVIARIKIPTGKFDFRKVESQLLKLQVTCSSGGKFIGRARSDVVKLLPKKRGGLSDAEVVVPVQWLNSTSQYAPVIEDPNRLEFSPSLSHFSEHTPDPNFAEHRITVTPVSMLGTQEQSLALYHDGSDSSPEQLLSNSYSDLSPEMYQIMEHENNSNNTNEQYMVLYNGNAEVIGNFRALNFYKASDINIKEDIRLISEFADARDVLMKIDGVDYKFKKGVNAAVNRRFVGYIAQQVESVVPDAVQLIDGILHVDYESLIPYLSESIRANFNDIKNNQAKTERIEKVVDMLYQQFLKQDRSKYSDSPSIPKKRSKLASRFTSLPLVWRVVVAVSIVAIVLAVATVIAILTIPSHNNYQPQPVSVPLPTTPITPITPTPTQTIPTPQVPPAPATLPFDPEGFRYQLIKLYQATDGGGWLRRDNWLSNESVCMWYGVQCSSPTISIDLSNNHLTGTLPEELAQIPMTKLVLANNLIEGTIPASFASLIDLKTLNVSGNKLNGRVPLKELLQLNLYVLDVSHNEFQGPISTPDNSVIQYLDLSHNMLGTQLPAFDKFMSLTHLDISYNNFFDNLPLLPSNLHYFSATQNRLFGRTSRLDSVGSWVQEGMQLVIDVSHNNLDGQFFYNEKRSPYIKYLNISFNGFTDVSTLYPTFSDFFECDARNNSFACPIPDWLTTRCGATCH